MLGSGDEGSLLSYAPHNGFQEFLCIAQKCGLKNLGLIVDELIVDGEMVPQNEQSSTLNAFQH